MRDTSIYILILHAVIVVLRLALRRIFPRLRFAILAAYFVLLPIALLGGAFSVTAEPVAQPWTEWPEVRIEGPAPAEVAYRLEPVWRLDCGLDAEEVIGRINGVAPGLDDRVLLGDSQLSQVLVVAPDGTIERIFGQPGEGPGDLQGTYRLFQTPDGRIGATCGVPGFSYQIGCPGRIVLTDLNDDPAGTWSWIDDSATGPVGTLRDLRCQGGDLLLVTVGLAFKPEGALIVEELSLRPIASGERVVLERRERIDDMRDLRIVEAEVFEPFAFGRCDLSAAGQVAYAPLRDEWLVVIRDAEGTGRTLRREVEARRRTRQQKEELAERLDQHAGCTVHDCDPLIGRLRWRPDGNLWVETIGAEPNPQALASFDEVSPQGEWLRRIHLLAPETYADPKLELLEDGRMVILDGFGRSGEETTGDVRAEVALMRLVEVTP